MSWTTTVVRGHRAHELGRALPDRRVGDAFEVGQSARVGEDDPPQRRPVQPAVGAEHSVTEAFTDGGEGRHTRFDDLAGHRVRVDDDRTQVRKERGDRRLARPDAPGETNSQHGAKRTRQRRRVGLMTSALEAGLLAMGLAIIVLVWWVRRLRTAVCARAPARSPDCTTSP